jgi:hypothetical protein
MRTNTPEDDGQLAPHTISNLTKMAANLSGAARVRCSHGLHSHILIIYSDNF